MEIYKKGGLVTIRLLQDQPIESFHSVDGKEFFYVENYSPPLRAENRINVTCDGSLARIQNIKIPNKFGFPRTYIINHVEGEDPTIEDYDV